MKSKTIVSTLVFLLMTGLIISCATAPTDGSETGNGEGGAEKRMYSFSAEVITGDEGTGSIEQTSTANGSYTPGEIVTVKAVAAVGDSFLGWYNAMSGGTFISSKANYTFSLNENTKLYAKFMNDKTTVTFADSTLENIVRGLASVPNGKLTYADVKGITFLDYVGTAPKQKITKLDGIEYLTGLTMLLLGSNEISNLAPLQKLTSITDLFLNDNQISNITPLENLTNIKYLLLGSNQLKDITPLENITALERLGLESNQISNISSLQNLNSIRYIWLQNNQISNILALKNSRGIDSGDTIYIIEGNTIDSADIDILRGKGATVQ